MRRNYHLILILLFIQFHFFASAQNSAKKGNTNSKNKKSNTEETQLKQIEKPVFDEKVILAKRPTRVINEELARVYENYLPGYRNSLVEIDKERHLFQDNNPIQLIIKTKNAYSIKDSYVEELQALIEKTKVEMMSDEEKKIYLINKSEEERKKAALPAQATSPE